MGAFGGVLAAAQALLRSRQSGAGYHICGSSSSTVAVLGNDSTSAVTVLLTAIRQAAIIMTAGQPRLNQQLQRQQRLGLCHTRQSGAAKARW
jgi:hypothetical protein